MRWQSKPQHANVRLAVAKTETVKLAPPTFFTVPLHRKYFPLHVTVYDGNGTDSCSDIFFVNFRGFSLAAYKIPPQYDLCWFLCIPFMNTD